MDLEFMYARSFALEAALLELMTVLPAELRNSVAIRLDARASQLPDTSLPQALPGQLQEAMRAQLKKLADDLAAIP